MVVGGRLQDALGAIRGGDFAAARKAAWDAAYALCHLRAFPGVLVLRPEAKGNAIVAIRADPCAPYPNILEYPHPVPVHTHVRKSTSLIIAFAAFSYSYGHMAG